jgi:hypothetical protein
MSRSFVTSFALWRRGTLAYSPHLKCRHSQSPAALRLNAAQWSGHNALAAPSVLSIGDQRP